MSSYPVPTILAFFQGAVCLRECVSEGLLDPAMPCEAGSRKRAPNSDVYVQFKGMPMTPQMAPMGYAPGPPGVHPPHGFMPMMPQYPLPFTVPLSGAPPSPLRSGPPGTIQPTYPQPTYPLWLAQS